VPPGRKPRERDDALPGPVDRLRGSRWTVLLIAVGFAILIWLLSAFLLRALSSGEVLDGEGLLWSVELRGDEEHASAAWHGDGGAPPLAEVVTGAALQRGVIMSAYSGLVVWIDPYRV